MRSKNRYLVQKKCQTCQLRSKSDKNRETVFFFLSFLRRYDPGNFPECFLSITYSYSQLSLPFFQERLPRVSRNPFPRKLPPNFRHSTFRVTWPTFHNSKKKKITIKRRRKKFPNQSKNSAMMTSSEAKEAK